jgi:hypothetical protein
MSFFYDSLSGGFDFWNLMAKPAGGYSAGDVVLYKNKYYGSLTSGNIYLPNEKIGLL